MKKYESSYFELNLKQAKTLLDHAEAGREDIFYDFGCGVGSVVRLAIDYSNVKKSIGIEMDKDQYNEARKLSKKIISKHPLRIDFWLGDWDSEDIDEEINQYIFDYKNATIVYNSNQERKNEIEFYNERLRTNTRIITKDLPLIGFKSIPNYDNNDCWFFLMKKPFKSMDNKDDWASSVDENFTSILDVYDYYYSQIYNRSRETLKMNRTEANKEATESLLELQILVTQRFKF